MGIKGRGSLFFRRKGWGGTTFSAGEKKILAFKAILGTLGVQKAQKSLKHAFGDRFELFLPTLGGFSHFSRFFDDFASFST